MEKARHKKIHLPLARAIVNTLSSIFEEGKKASKAIELTLRSNKQWGSRDRSFIAENSYDIVRWWRLLHFINNSPTTEVRPKNLWHILGSHLSMNKFTLPDCAEFRDCPVNAIPGKLKEAKLDNRIKGSIPDWLEEIGQNEFKELWPQELQALNEKADVYLRVNTLKTNAQELINTLSQEGIKVKLLAGTEHTIRVIERKNLFSTKAFHNGMFEVQDAGSQLIAPFLEVTPGMRVIDACAGAGGKTLHLASLMENKGSIIAMDTEPWKLKELKKRARRNDVHNVETRSIEGSKTIKRLHKKADRLLLDVPCTGLGVLRRNPDAKWKIDPNYLDRLKDIQKNILNNYSKMLKVGGKMVYATCSILRDENHNQVLNFLEEHDNFILEREQFITPRTHGFDGFYMALLKKDS